MRIFVYLGPSRFGAASRDAAERRLRGALDRIAGRVERASLFVTDVNGTKGGCDLRCVCVIRLRGAKPVVIRETGSRLAPLLERAIDRALRATTERTGRRFRSAGDPPYAEFVA